MPTLELQAEVAEVLVATLLQGPGSAESKPKKEVAAEKVPESVESTPNEEAVAQEVPIQVQPGMALCHQLP